MRVVIPVSELGLGEPKKVSYRDEEGKLRTQWAFQFEYVLLDSTILRFEDVTATLRQMLTVKI